MWIFPYDYARTDSIDGRQNRRYGIHIYFDRIFLASFSIRITGERM